MRGEDRIAQRTTTPPAQQAIQRLERLALWLDDGLRIPGTRIRLGLDALIGLIPVVGDAAGLILGGWVIVEAHRAGAPAALKWQMTRNVATDALLGLVPVVGDIFDFAFRSNRRNLDLLLAHLRPPVAAIAPPVRWPWVIGLLLAALTLLLVVKGCS